MNRLIRMAILLIVATVFSTRLPVNLVVVAIALLAMEKFEIGDLVVILFASLCLDHFNMLPLGFSFLPLLAMVCLVYLLKSKIYVHAMMSRLLWLSCAVGVFYLTTDALLMARSSNSLYLWNGLLWGGIHAVVEGSLAAALSPWVHRLLTLSLADLRRSRSIVVPYDRPFHFRNLPLPSGEGEGGLLRIRSGQAPARRGEGAGCS